MNLKEALWENLKEPLWERGKYMEYLDEISAYKSVKNDQAKEQVDIKMKMQDLSKKECLVQEYTVDLGNPLDKKIVYVKIPMRLEDFDFSDSLPYCDEIYKSLIKEEKNMPIYMTNYDLPDELKKMFGLQTKTPDNKPKWLEGLPAVKKVETYNDRVVKVTFIDGTFTKAVCSENDNFDLDMGITICAMKRLLGTNSDNATREYNRFINHVHSVMEKNSLEEVAEEARQAKEKSRKRKAELKRAAKKLKAKEEAIDIQKQAIIRAHQEMGAMDQ